MKQILINILVNLIPYYFTKFYWYRHLIYCSTNKYSPIDLDLLDKELDSSKNYIALDLYGYYEDTYL